MDVRGARRRAYHEGLQKPGGAARRPLPDLPRKGKGTGFQGISPPLRERARERAGEQRQSRERSRPLLALDFGTSTLRALVGTASGRPLASAQAPVRYFVPEGLSSMAREFSADEVFAGLVRLIREALSKADVGGNDIIAIGITSQRQGVVFMDARGKELYAAPNADFRAALDGAAIDEECGAEVYRTTGHLPSLMYAPARLRWLRAQRPEACDRISQVLPIASWLLYRLTGESACEPAVASEAGLLDVASRQPCAELLERLGLPARLLPPLAGAGTPMGALLPEVAKATGLAERTAVTIAGPDTQCGLLAMGVTGEDMTGVVAGWSCTAQLATARPCFDGSVRTWTGILPLPERWLSESNLGDAGNAYRWLVDMLLSGNDKYAQAEALAREVPPGADGTLAFLGPGVVSMARAGLRAGGFIFPVPVSFQETTRGRLLRAYLENVAFSLRANLETLQEVTGLTPAEVRIGGGMSQSRLLCEIAASVLGRPVLQSERPEVSTIGALLGAAVAAGECRSLAEAVDAAAVPSATVPPDASLAAEYEDHYGRWREACARVQEVE